MADSSLDQFFAKKDKSKKKSKGKVTSEQMAKKMEDTGKIAEKSVKDREKQENSSGKISTTIPSLEQADEEWNDFEEEKEVDYSGLRIQSLTITEKEREEEGNRDQQDEDNEEFPSSGDQQSGPWKMQAAAAAAHQAPTPAPAEPEPEVPPPRIEEPKEPQGSNQPQAYRPPHLRSGAASRTSSSPGGQSSGAKRGAGGRFNLDYTSEEQFPALGADSHASRGQRGPEVPDRSFTSVKHGLRNREDPTQHHLQLDLENKYSALHQRDGN